MTGEPLADQTLDRVAERLEGFGSSLSGDSRVAIHALLTSLEAGLRGELEPAYYLSAIDPGIGKTLSVATFLRAWKEGGFDPSSSVLIGVSRLEEIETYLEHAGLDRTDIAVLTSNPDMNALGTPQTQHDHARVFFTTQQMIESRTKGKAFGNAYEFHYQGKPRVLRIWDESLTLAEPLTLRVDDLGLLASPLRHTHPALIREVRSLQRALWDVVAGDVVQVPASLATLAPARRINVDPVGAVVETLKHLGGRAVTVVEVGSGDMRLAGSAAPFPDDFAPVIILDASGRVRSTYRLWEDALGNLRRLPTAANDYRRLRVHLWERAVGKDAFGAEGTREDVVAAVISIIKDGGHDGHWLVITYKDYGEMVEDALRRAVEFDDSKRLHVLTWGRHHGTNAFGDFGNVVIIGQPTYGQASYPALASAACGGHAVPEGALGMLKEGEYRHHLLQALTRASVRRSVNGVAGACNAYIVTSPGNRAREAINATFPGCAIEPWSPPQEQVGGQAGELIGLLEAYGLAGADTVTKKELRDSLGVNGPNFSRLLRHAKVEAYMDRKHLRSDRMTVFGWVRFDAFPEGGWTIDQLDAELV